MRVVKSLNSIDAPKESSPHFPSLELVMLGILFPSTYIVCMCAWSFFKDLFIYFRARESRRECVSMGRGRGGERPQQTLCSAQSPTWGSVSQPWDHDLSSNQESDAQPTAPHVCIILKKEKSSTQGVLHYTYHVALVFHLTGLRHHLSLFSWLRSISKK